MKDSLFELLLNLFEKTLMQLKEEQKLSEHKEKLVPPVHESSETSTRKVAVRLEHLQSAQGQSLRVLTPEEQTKLTKKSYQLLMRLLSWGLISAEALELVLNRLFFSDSRFVSLEETQWTVRNTLEDILAPEQFAFLDFVLYQKEDGLSIQ
jgi:uncharacterized protein Smg (DUF494 family)